MSVEKRLKAIHESLVRLEDHQILSARLESARHSEIIGYLKNLTLKNEENDEFKTLTQRRLADLEKGRGTRLG